MIPAFPPQGKLPTHCVLASDMAITANSHAIPGLAASNPSPLLALADRCVQCGLCLPHCPTYGLDRNEAESPRGRIALARALTNGSLIATALADAHLDHCLGCRRCEPVCPAGVEYGALLLQTRHEQRIRRGASRRQSFIEWLAARPRLLDRLLGVYRIFYSLLPKWLPRPPARRSAALIAPASMPSNPMPSNPAPSPLSSARVADTNKSASLFRGCLARRYDADVHNALHRLCSAAGIRLIEPASQTCCGALHAHAGNADAAAALAADNRGAFAAGVPVLSTATGCHESLAQSLAGHAPVRDAAEFLLQHADALRFHPANRRVALHIPCTQRSVVRSDGALRALLKKIPALSVIELIDSGCCGAAGMHMLEFPERARALRQPLLDAFAASGADVLVTANVGCRLHLQAGVEQAGTQMEPTITIRHPLAFLADYLDTGPTA